MFFLCFLFLFFFFVFILLSVAFTTLFERHLLSLSQSRLGPNKTVVFGVLQAVLDGVKLIKKEQILPLNSSEYFFLFFPSVLFFVLFLEWLCLSYSFFFFNFQFSFLFLLCLVGFSVYSSLLSSIMSKSKYSSVGGLRASSQSVSFEIAFSLFFLCFFFLLSSLEISFLFCFFLFLLFFPFFFVSLAELGRAPFDFSEGESELVSGYNTEFSSVAFALLFLGEYGVLLFFCALGSVFFFFGSFFFFFFFFGCFFFFAVVFPVFVMIFWCFFFESFFCRFLFFFFFFFLFFSFFNFFFFLDFFSFFFVLSFVFFLGENMLKGVSFSFFSLFVESVGCTYALPLGSLISFFSFFFLLFCCFGGYFCYSFVLCSMLEFTFSYSFLAWLSAFLVFISSEKFSAHMSKEGDSYLKTSSMLFIELVSEFSRPVALTVRLTVNILVGYLIGVVLYSGVELFFGDVFFWLFLFAILMECFVFFIQSYIFSRLVFLYLNE